MILAQTVWMVVLFGSLQFFGVFSVEQFYILSYVGFVVLAGLFAPTEPTPRWWRGIQLLVLLGFLGLCYFIFERAADIVFV